MASDSAHEFLLRITESVRRYVESLQEGGVTGLPRASARELGETEKAEHGKSSSAPRFPSAATSRPRPPLQPIVTPAVAAQAGDLFLSPAVQTVQTLEGLRAEIGDCRRCKLCQGRTKIVF